MVHSRAFANVSSIIEQRDYEHRINVSSKVWELKLTLKACEVTISWVHYYFACFGLIDVVKA